jgi:GntR family transcriptional repressor for pyruvate dehydrogenase complex
MVSVSELGFERINTRRVFEEVCEQIHKQLVAGVLKPGDKLPSERDLATEFGVSRPVIREAIRTMEISGILEQRKGVKGGSFIRTGTPDMITKSLQNLLVVGRISVAGLTEARKIIQDAVTRLACERGTASDFDAIEANLHDIDSFVENKDWAARSEAAVTFFRLISQATHNETLVVLVDALSDIIRYFVQEKAGPRYRPELIPIRWKILEHLRAREPDKAAKQVGLYLDVVHCAVLKESAADAPAKAKARAPAKSTTKRAPGSGQAGAKAAALAQGAKKAAATGRSRG